MRFGILFFLGLSVSLIGIACGSEDGDLRGQASESVYCRNDASYVVEDADSFLCVDSNGELSGAPSSDLEQQVLDCCGHTL